VKTILAPVDFSPATEAVVAETARLAKALPAKVVVLAVIQPPVITSEYAALMENSGEILAAGEKNAARRLTAIEDQFRAAGVAVETMQCVGAPIQHIVRQAASADYLVMGSHGHTALYDLLVGSTTHGVLMRAKCPVVIVPAVAKPTKTPI
jgi:nucleotide-binding universal stress UspA family protein